MRRSISVQIRKEKKEKKSFLCLVVNLNVSLELLVQTLGAEWKVFSIPFTMLLVMTVPYTAVTDHYPPLSLKTKRLSQFGTYVKRSQLIDIPEVRERIA